jgi:hypothetical protein
LEALTAVHGTYSEAASVAINRLYAETILHQHELGEQINGLRNNLTVKLSVPIRVRFVYEPMQLLKERPAWTVLKCREADKSALVTEVLEIGFDIYGEGQDYIVLNTTQVMEAV